MIIGILQIELRFPESQSLKDKRMILKSLKDRLRQQFNISVSELDYQESWQRALLGIAAIGGDKRYTNGLLSKVLDWVAEDRSAELVSSHMELL
ncbi:MAG: DUF503 domain-containing protein [Candidatus Omnitrophota bacterium]